MNFEINPDVALAADVEAATRLPADRRRAAFSFVKAGGLTVRPPEWLVRGYIEADTVGVGYGRFGSLKSFAFLDLAFSVATGSPWLGNETKLGPVLYIAGEGCRVARSFLTTEDFLPIY